MKKSCDMEYIGACRKAYVDFIDGVNPGFHVSTMGRRGEIAICKIPTADKGFLVANHFYATEESVFGIKDEFKRNNFDHIKLTHGHFYVDWVVKDAIAFSGTVCLYRKKETK